MSQEEAQLYLTTISSFLQSNGDATNAALLDEASFFFQKRFYHELSEKLLEVFVLPKEVSPYLRESAYEINEKLFLPLRADISPFSYIKLTYFVCFSHLSSEDDRFNDNNFERALAVLDGAVVSLVAQQQEQGKHAAQCIRALLLLEEAFRSDTFQQVQTPHKGKEQQGTTMHTTQSSLQALAAVPGSGPHTARKILEEAEQFLSSLQSHEVEDVLLYFLYKARGKDYQLRKQFSEFYHNSFNMVLFAEKAQLSMSEAELTHLAYQSALSALLAENVFNVGRFLQFTPFTERLAPSSPCAWALEWLTLFDAGDVKGFAMFYNSHKDVIDREEDIRATLPQLLHKSRLMALLHLVFYTPFHKRTFTYQQIAERCNYNPNQNNNNNNNNNNEEDSVELLLLDALAQGIVRGSLDGVEETVLLEWVQPRVLRPGEVHDLASHIHVWREEANKLYNDLTVLRAE